MVPDKDGMYQIDDMIMPEKQMMAAFGIKPSVSLRTVFNFENQWTNGTIPVEFENGQFSQGEIDFVLNTVADRFNQDMRSCLQIM